MFENKDFGKYLNFKNEVIGFGVISVESWISATVVFIFLDLYSRNIIWMIKSRRWAGHVTRMEKALGKGNTFKT